MTIPHDPTGWQKIADSCATNRPSVGKTVIVDSGKHKGKQGKVFWHGVDKYASTRYSTDVQLMMREMMGRHGYRVGIETADGEKFFVTADKVTVIYPALAKAWASFWRGFAHYAWLQMNCAYAASDQWLSAEHEAERDGGFVMEIGNSDARTSLHYYRATRFQSWERFVGKILFDDRADDVEWLIAEYHFRYGN